MLKRLYYILVFIALVFITCTRENIDSKVIETRTSLSYIEIINYEAKLTGSLSSGYKKESFTLIGNEALTPSAKEDYNSASKDDENLFFDSTKFSFLKKIERSDFVKKNSLTSHINKEEISISSEFPELKGKSMKLLSVSSKLDEKLFFTLEVPEDKSLNWSLVKVWKVSEHDNTPQIHSVLFARANNFESLAYKKSSILLKEGEMVYRVELNKEKRFHKKMNVYVSLFTETP